MAINLLENVQQNLGYPALQKIDPNTQQVVKSDNIQKEDKFSQAAIPAVLTGLYRYVQSDEGAVEVLQNDAGADWIGKIFNDNKSKAIHAVATYALQNNEFTGIKMNAIAMEAIRLLKIQLSGKAEAKDVRGFFDGERNNILLHLPPDLQIGELLGDNNLDDNTYKMDGGISGLIQSIGTLFSSSGSHEDSSKK